MAINPKIVKNIAWLLCEHGVRIFTGLITTGILARVLSVEEYGNFQYIAGLIVIFASISYIVPGEVVIPLLTNANANERKIIMGNGFIIRFVSSVISYFALLSFVYFSDDITIFYLSVVLASSILVNESFGIVTAYLQSQTMIKYRSALVMGTHIFKILLYLLLYGFGVTSIYLYALANIIEIFLIALGLALVYKYLTKEWFFGFDRKEAKKLFLQGMPFFIGLMVMFLSKRIDYVFIKQLSDAQSLGFYTSAMSLLNIVITISPIIVISLAPSFIYKHENLAIIKKNTFKLSLIVFLIALFLVAVLYFLAPFFINLIFGAKFSGTIPVFKFLILVLPLIFLNEALSVYINKMKLGKILIYKSLLVLVSSSLAFIILIPKFGAYGGIIGYGVGYGMACVFGLFVILRHNNELLREIK